MLKQITLEPLTFLESLSYTVDRGAQVTSDLIIWKICHIELNYTNDICGNLTNSGFEVNNIHTVLFQKLINIFDFFSFWQRKLFRIEFAKIKKKIKDVTLYLKLFS